MTKKPWLLVALAVALGGISLYLNKDWFARDDIHIFHRSRPGRTFLSPRKRGDGPQVAPITFGFNRRLKLTCVKVIPLSDIATNKYPEPIWHLISSSNSVPTKDFMYGDGIQGMRPAVKGATADPLEAGVQYRLYVEAGPIKAEHDFAPVAATP